MPFQSLAQQRWAYTPAGTKALGGPEKVKEWQADTPKKLPEHKMEHDSASHGLAHASKKSPVKKHQKELHIKEMHTGGYLVHKHDGKGGPPTEHMAPTLEDAHDLLQDHLGEADQPEEPDAAPQAASA